MLIQELFSFSGVKKHYQKTSPQDLMDRRMSLPPQKGMCCLFLFTYMWPWKYGKCDIYSISLDEDADWVPENEDKKKKKKNSKGTADSILSRMYETYVNDEGVPPLLYHFLACFYIVFQI